MKINKVNSEIGKALSIVKYQRELQVLLCEIKDRKLHDIELLKRCQSCAINIARLKPFVKKELLELTESEKKETNKLLKDLYLKI